MPITNLLLDEGDGETSYAVWVGNDIIPLSEAVFCQSCQCITRSTGSFCRSCGGSEQALISLARWLRVV